VSQLAAFHLCALLWIAMPLGCDRRQQEQATKSQPQPKTAPRTDIQALGRLIVTVQGLEKRIISIGSELVIDGRKKT